MEITFSLPHVFHPGSTPEENSFALRALLECLININLGYLHNHAVPSLYKSGVVYARTQVWDSLPALYAKQYGDCKSLTAARVAEKRRNGEDCSPVFRWIRRPNGAKDFHILVMNADGTFEDPSKICGMPTSEITDRG